MTNPRPWSIEELHEGDVRGLTRGPYADQRVVHRVPTAAQQLDVQWRSTDKWTRALIKELIRLGYDVANITPELVYLTNVGRLALTVVLRVDSRVTGLTVARVTIGHASRTPRQATLWLRKRAPR